MMKRLTLNHLARANLRINRKAYRSLFLGILLAVFLSTATSVCVWGAIRGHEEQMAQRVGWMDMYMIGSDGMTDEQLRNCGFFREIGHVTVNAQVENSLTCAGYYDETAEKLMNRTMVEGRMPERTGEVAAERSALVRLGLENIAVGDTLTLEMCPIRGVPEERSWTLVGILNEQTDYLLFLSEEEGMRFPALLVSPEETYEVGSAVVHRVLTYAPLITFNQVLRKLPGMDMACGVSRETGGAVFWDSGWERAGKTLNRVLLWAVFGAALMLSACVGIASAMESLLARKTQDIGMLRAVGATRRQIRRIYGAEAWVLTATALPAGLLGGLGIAWVLSRAFPDQLVFSLNVWLLIPILGLSVLCVFVASRVPLYVASRQMPMGVLRDTGMLRRAGKLRNHKIFKADRLIAERRTRLHPLRHLSAAGMTALALISTLMLGELALGMRSGRNDQTADFRLWNPDVMISDDTFSQLNPENGLTREELYRIRSLEGVEHVRTTTEITGNLLMDEVPEYFRPRDWFVTYENGETVLTSIGTLEGACGQMDWLFYSAEDLADARARRSVDGAANMYVDTIERMNLICSWLGLSETMVPVRICVADLDLEALKGAVTEGTLDPEKLDRGEQVLVYAPTVCARKEEEGGFYIDRWLPASQIREEDWDLVIRNDAFRAGMPLKLLELAGKEPGYEVADLKTWYQSMDAVRADVTVGAVLSGQAVVNEYFLTGFTVIVSEKGAEAMGLKLPSPENVDIRLAGNPTVEQETEIQNRLEQIVMRSGMTVENNLQEIRAYQAKKQRQLLLFAALILLFFAVSVAMQVSGASRRIRSETRMIGTLRAVGADLKTLVGCYRLPVWVSAAWGLIPPLLMYAASAVPQLRLFTAYHPLIMIPLLFLLAGCIALACTVGIRNRMAAVIRQSIVENIREL